MPASEPSSAARGVILRIHGADEAADHQHEALDEHPGEPRAPCLQRIAGADQDRQHHDEDDDEHMRDADPRRQRADIGPPGLDRQLAGQPGVIDGAQEQHQPDRRQDAAEDDRIGQLEHEPQQPGQHQHVDENVGAEAEKGVPVPRRPPGNRARRAGLFGRGRHDFTPLAEASSGSAGAVSAAITLEQSLTQPKIPPWAAIIRSAVSWNSGK